MDGPGDRPRASISRPHSGRLNGGHAFAARVSGSVSRQPRSRPTWCGTRHHVAGCRCGPVPMWPRPDAAETRRRPVPTRPACRRGQRADAAGCGARLRPMVPPGETRRSVAARRRLGRASPVPARDLRVDRRKADARRRTNRVRDRAGLAGPAGATSERGPGPAMAGRGHSASRPRSPTGLACGPWMRAGRSGTGGPVAEGQRDRPGTGERATGPTPVTPCRSRPPSCRGRMLPIPHAYSEQ